MNQYGKEYPTSVDYFIPAGKYADLFTQALGEKPQTITIVFPDDNPQKVCDERLEYRDNAGALVARGDGREFEVWNGKKYVVCSIEQYPNLLEQIAEKYPKKPRGEDDNGWDIALTMRFIIPAVRGVVGVWGFTTKAKSSSIKNLRDSFDAVQAMRGTVTTSAFDLSVHLHKSNKPNQSSRYPVLDLVCNDARVSEIQKLMKPTESMKNLLISD